MKYFIPQLFCLNKTNSGPHEIKSDSVGKIIMKQIDVVKTNRGKQYIELFRK